MSDEVQRLKQQIQESNQQKSAADMENTIKSMLDDELHEIRRRVEDLESKEINALPIVQLTPNSDLNDVKKTVNYLLNYLVIGIKNG